MLLESIVDILRDEDSMVGKINDDDDTQVYICREDILFNMECNLGQCDLDWIQDFSGIDGSLIQGYSLSDIDLIKA